MDLTTTITTRWFGCTPVNPNDWSRQRIKCFFSVVVAHRLLLDLVQNHPESRWRIIHTKTMIRTDFMKFTWKISLDMIDSVLCEKAGENEFSFLYNLKYCLAFNRHRRRWRRETQSKWYGQDTLRVCFVLQRRVSSIVYTLYEVHYILAIVNEIENFHSTQHLALVISGRNQS